MRSNVMKEITLVTWEKVGYLTGINILIWSCGRASDSGSLQRLPLLALLARYSFGKNWLLRYKCVCKGSFLLLRDLRHWSSLNVGVWRSSCHNERFDFGKFACTGRRRYYLRWRDACQSEKSDRWIYGNVEISSYFEISPFLRNFSLRAESSR